MFKFWKYPFYSLFSYVLKSRFFRSEIWYAISDFFGISPLPSSLKYYSNPYYKSDFTSFREVLLKKKPLFITGRFRSGSTFLWLIFRNTPGITAYYEPLNENRWFLSNKFRVDPTHRGVKDYSSEYQGLDYLNKFFQQSWTYRKLYMTEKDYDANLFHYLLSLISASPSRPVLQFNRIDFRLPWIKSNFPGVPILHIIRDPRDQWISVMRDSYIPPDFVIETPDNLSLFYTIPWAQDLKKVFPFLEPIGQHPYKIHYFLWRLSYIFGVTYSDYTIKYEDLCLNFEEEIRKIFDYFHLLYDDSLIKKLSLLNKPPSLNKWHSYASPEWFSSIESECERILFSFFKKL